MTSTVCSTGRVCVAHQIGFDPPLLLGTSTSWLGRVARAHRGLRMSSPSASTPTTDVVELDSLVVLKIIQHCQEALPTFVTGQLLGLDIGRTLEVTNCFPFPNKSEAEPQRGGAEEDADDDGAEYQMEMMRCLREVNVDNNTVGWYQSTYFSSFIDESCIETQVGCPAREVSSRRAVVRRARSAGSAFPPDA